MKKESLFLCKKHICLLLLSLFVFFMLVGCSSLTLFSNQALKPIWFTQISITDSRGNASIFTDDKRIAYYVEAFNSAITLDEDIPADTLDEYRIVLEGKKPRQLREFTLYLDESLENRTLFIQKDKKLKRINNKYFNEILTETVFEPVYPHLSPPQIMLQYDSCDYTLEPGSYQWRFRKTDMKYYDAAHKQPGCNGNIGLTLDGTGLPIVLTEIEPDSIKWIFLQDDKQVLSLEEIEKNDLLLEDGMYQCLLELYWFEIKDRGFYGKVHYSFIIQIDNPPDIRISSLQTDPGELLVITVNHVNPGEEVTITTEFDFKPNVFGKDRKKVILLPVSYYHKTNKTYSIEVIVGGVSEFFEVKVLDKEFTTQYMTIDPKIAAATRNEQSAREVTEKIAPLRPVCDDEKYWEGAFIQPVEGGRVRPADFGKRRYVNNSPTSYRHNGLDIGQAEGTPVKAVNHGRVLFADDMIGTGNTVIIEHGYGLKSWYYHMVSLNTKDGDMVKKGDVIGLVGSTGFSTSPHLHLSISVNHVFVNPMSFFNDGVPMQ